MSHAAVVSIENLSIDAVEVDAELAYYETELRKVRDELNMYKFINFMLNSVQSNLKLKEMQQEVDNLEEITRNLRRSKMKLR